MELTDIQSKMSPFIGRPPVIQQRARFGVALAIIAEHAFYLWDRAPSDDAGFFISAIDAYESSAKHTAVTQAIDEAFAEDGGRLFEDAKDSDNPKEFTFAKRLVQIALDNRLPPPH